MFRTDSASMKWSFLGTFWALTFWSQILSNFDEFFTRGSIQGEKKCVLRIFEKFKFLLKREIPKVCTSGPTLTPRFSLKMAEIEKKALSLLAFPRNIRLLFALFWLFSAGNQPRSKAKGSESKFETTYFTNTVPGHLPFKKVWFQHFPVLRL